MGFSWVRSFLLLLLPTAVWAGPLHDAAKSGDAAAIEALLASGEDINASDGRGTALSYAVTKGHTEVVRLLLANGADPNSDSAGGPPLTIAAWKGNASVVDLLLKHGANPNAAFRTETALHSAAERGALDVVKLLVAAKADVNALNKDREPAIHYAMKKGHREVGDYLRSHGFEPPKPPPISPRLASASATAGAALFAKTCHTCHDATPQKLHFRGPPLWNIIGRSRASYPDTKYSTAMKEWKGEWTYEDLNVFLSDPTRALPGTDMGSPGYQDIQDRADVVAYLGTLTDKSVPPP